MKKREWRQLVEDIYHQEIATKLRRARRRMYPEEYPNDFERLYRASRTIRFIEQFDNDETDVAAAVTRSHLRSTIQDIKYAHRETNEYLLLESGIVEALEVHMQDVLSELDVSDLPEEDIEALRRAGSYRPRSELRVRIRRIKAHYMREERNRNQMSIASCVLEAGRQLDQKIQELEEPAESAAPKKAEIAKPHVKRKWFKGLGSICRGTVLTGVDVSLLAGWWSLPLAPDTTIVGSVASIVTGLGDIAIGVGEFRGE